MSHHRIRLRGPWQYRVVSREFLTEDACAIERDAPLPPPGSIHAPEEWDAPFQENFWGRVAYIRQFNRPTGLEDARVWLTVEGTRPLTSLALNGHLLSADAGVELPAAFDVTEMLQPHNEISLEIERLQTASSSTDDTSVRGAIAPGQARTGLQEVYLEIRQVEPTTN
jgi:beta-galactosidase/beta-glucuronidase